MNKISIIVPMYNVSLYIDDFVKSLILQSIDRKKVEYIFIDDKSTDDTREKIVQYADFFDKLIFNETNYGLGKSRNIGMNIATGSHIMFYDSDDIIPPNALEKLYENIEEDVDIVIGNYKRFNSKGEKNSFNDSIFADKITNFNQTPQLVYELTAWNKLYKKAFIDNIDFSWDEGILYEDMYPNYRAIRMASKIKIISDVIYKWRIRETDQSITQRKMELKNLKDRYLVLSKMFAFLNENNLEDINGTLAQRILIDLSYYINEVDITDIEYVNFLKNECRNLISKVGIQKLEYFSNIRVETKMNEKKRRAKMEKFFYFPDEYIAENKINFIFLFDSFEKIELIKSIAKSLSNTNDRIIVISNDSVKVDNVEKYSSFSDVKSLVNSYIVHNATRYNKKEFEIIRSEIGNSFAGVISYERFNVNFVRRYNLEKIDKIKKNKLFLVSTNHQFSNIESLIDYELENSNMHLKINLLAKKILSKRRRK